MRKTTLVRGGALLTAATLALTLGSGPASAHDSHASVTGFRPQHLAAPGPASSFSGSQSVTSAQSSIASITMQSGVLFQPGLNGIDGDLEIFPGTSTPTFQTTVKIAGVDKGKFPLFGEGVVVPSTIGLGKAQLGPTTISYSDGTPANDDATLSNPFYIRRALGQKPQTTHDAKFLISRHNKKIKFKAYYVKIFRPSTGTYVSLGKIELQYKSGHKWKHVKSIKLNSTGTGSYTTKTSKKHHYRFYVKTSPTLLGNSSVPSHNI